MWCGVVHACEWADVPLCLETGSISNRKLAVFTARLPGKQVLRSTHHYSEYRSYRYA